MGTAIHGRRRYGTQQEQAGSSGNGETFQRFNYRQKDTPVRLRVKGAGRMVGTRHEQGRTLRGAQAIAGLYSILFFFLISSGYYLLFQQNLLLALGAALLFSLLAWWLAKFIGSSRSGIRGHLPLFILLLLISAVGVFNSLMLNLEGRRIFVEAIDRAHDQFERLSNRAAIELSRGGSGSPLAHLQRVDDLKAALFSEIRNPLNCGQGPEARKIVGNLREELPEFRALSNGRPDCTQNTRVVEDYERRINELAAGAPWNNQVVAGVAAAASQAKRELDQLLQIASDSYGPRLLSEVAPQLEAKGGQYRDLVERLPAGDARAGLPPRLDLRGVESLGEWSQLINLLLDRVDKPTTYFYLLLAGFADWMMVHLFGLVSVNRTRRSDPDIGANSVGRGFA